MKIHIIQLEPHDDLISVRDKLSWAKTERILLVWPVRGQTAVRSFDIVLLQRYANSMGVTMAVVSQDADIRFAARSSGIQVFSRTVDAIRKDWQRSAPVRLERRGPRKDFREIRDEIRIVKPGWLSRPLIRLAIFSSGVLAVIIILLLILPSAELTLEPERVNQTITIPVTSAEGVDNVNLTGLIPSRAITKVVEGRQLISSSGTTTVPDKTARGKVRLVNLTENDIIIPSGTVILSRGTVPIRFSTTEGGLVPASDNQGLEIPVEAVTPGASGNLPPDSLIAIEGRLGLSLAVNNQEPMSGGSDRLGPIPTTEDRTRLRSQLMESLYQSALVEMQAGLHPGDLVFENTLKDVNIIVESYYPEEGQTVSQLALTMRVEFQANYASFEDISRLSLEILNSNLEESYTAVENSMSYFVVPDSIREGENTISFDLQINREIYKAFDPAEITKIVRGRSAAIARDQLQSILKLPKTPSIFVYPKWWPFVSLLPFRIQISYK